MLENTESQEMYLTTIYALQKKNGMVRSVDVADERGYSKVSVHMRFGCRNKEFTKNFNCPTEKRPEFFGPFLKVKKEIERTYSSFKKTLLKIC